MNTFARVGALLLATAAPGAQAAPQSLPADVPAKHWAASAVRQVLDAGLMTAPNGRFSGQRAVTRNELISVLVRASRALERRSWPETKVEPIREAIRPAQWKSAAVTRYHLAATLARMMPIALAGLPDKPAARPFDSEAIPQRPSLKGVPRTSPVYRELEYLAARRMVWEGSPLLKPGTQPVTGSQLSTALAQMIAGLSGVLTDEPEDVDLVPPRR
ncbi:MAG: S-layer homology domain-containing protein [Chthonomonadales bacterium]|nr:S-layer homology domain-containing protein [Chthonomonadales bacterium]